MRYGFFFFLPKVLIVGNGAVGKSSLIQKYLDGSLEVVPTGRVVLWDSVLLDICQPSRYLGHFVTF